MVYAILLFVRKQVISINDFVTVFALISEFVCTTFYTIEIVVVFNIAVFQKDFLYSTIKMVNMEEQFLVPVWDYETVVSYSLVTLLAYEFPSHFYN